MNSCVAMPFSFEAFYTENLSLVRRVVSRYRFRDAAADDLVQDIFLQAWRKHDQVREVSAMRSWLLTIARHACLNVRKQEKVVLSLSSDFSEANLDQLLSVEDSSAELHFEMALSALSEFLEAQQNKERAAIARDFYLEALSVKEIAERYQMKQNTVLSHLRRFRLLAAQTLLELAEEKGCDREKVLTACR